MTEQPHLLDPLRVNWQRTTSGISLFHPIPERNCSTAGIPGKHTLLTNSSFKFYCSYLDKYCPCSHSVPMDIDQPIIKQLAMTSVDYINNVKLEKHRHLCMHLQLKEIIRAEVEQLQVPIIGNDTAKSNFTLLYVVLFEVSPSNGIFESRLVHDPIKKTVQLQSGILRINLYGQTSACIQDKYDLRSFCYCTSYHNRIKMSLLRGKQAFSRNSILS